LYCDFCEKNPFFWRNSFSKDVNAAYSSFGSISILELRPLLSLNCGLQNINGAKAKIQKYLIRPPYILKMPKSLCLRQTGKIPKNMGKGLGFGSRRFIFAFNCLVLPLIAFSYPLLPSSPLFI
jgi:hypothetical protein